MSWDLKEEMAQVGYNEDYFDGLEDPWNTDPWNDILAFLMIIVVLVTYILVTKLT